MLPDEGPVLDLGCGIGHSFKSLKPRATVGVDLEFSALRGQKRSTCVADMRSLPFRDESFASVLSVQSIEHVPDPENVLLEVKRVLEPQGAAIFVTPNRLTFARPDEIIDPYHYREFDPSELRSLCSNFFADVDVVGLFGSPAFNEFWAEQLKTLDRILALDPLKLRRMIPRRARQFLYDWQLTRQRKDNDDARYASIGPKDFFVGPANVDRSFDLIAVCKKS